ncbi:MAG: hypothetical protein WBV36_12320 [Terriglobales bacterium]|jgi:hypothetical protein
MRMQIGFPMFGSFAVMGAQTIFNPVMNPLPYDPYLAMTWQWQE